MGYGQYIEVSLCCSFILTLFLCFNVGSPQAAGKKWDEIMWWMCCSHHRGVILVWITKWIVYYVLRCGWRLYVVIKVFKAGWGGTGRLEGEDRWILWSLVCAVYLRNPWSKLGSLGFVLRWVNWDENRKQPRNQAMWTIRGLMLTQFPGLLLCRGVDVSWISWGKKKKASTGIHKSIEIFSDVHQSSGITLQELT